MKKNVDFLTPDRSTHIIVPEYLKNCYLESNHYLLPKNYILKQLLVFINIKILRKLKIIFNIIIYKKISFTLPEQRKLVVYDDENFEVLNKLILNKDYFLLKTRLNKIDVIYINLGLIFCLIKNFFKRSIKENYIKYLLETINPKKVITIIDNSTEFFRISKALHNKMKFIAIQNSHRYEIHANNSELFIPNYYVFGDYEVELFKKRIGVKKIKAIGSICAAVAKREIKKNFDDLDSNRYDICLVSEPRLKLNRDFQRIHKNHNVQEIMEIIASHTIRYCEEHNKKLIFSGKADIKSLNFQRQEELFYERAIKNKKIKISFNNKSKFEQYKNIHNSKLIIGMSSTMLRDAFEFEKKILICNFFDNPDNKPPSEGICTLKDKSYNAFKNRVSEILLMTYERYISKIQKVNNFYNLKLNTLKILEDEIK